jgi:isopentenyldiphosphate isomerase
MEEFIDEIDENGTIISSHPKSLLKEKMFLHKVCLVLPTASDGKFILSRRAKNKFPFPDTWCCAVGGKISSVLYD